MKNVSLIIAMLNHRARFCDMCRRENPKSEIRNRNKPE